MAASSPQGLPPDLASPRIYPRPSLQESRSNGLTRSLLDDSIIQGRVYSNNLGARTVCTPKVENLDA
ncbi:hypothetical protein CCMA1212_000639 [Trichoderma ghanense]|uniref:Uncharacterized protein n=1 Tax=Trichoderma ghanense TaxID=65468 RepID=A0ABY2HGR1_9HYPO